MSTAAYSDEPRRRQFFLLIEELRMPNHNEQIDLEKYRLPKRTVDCPEDRWICGPNHRSFTLFLTWLVYEHCFDAHQIIKVVEKPWRWQSEFNSFVDVRDIEI